MDALRDTRFDHDFRKGGYSLEVRVPGREAADRVKLTVR